MAEISRDTTLETITIPDLDNLVKLEYNKDEFIRFIETLIKGVQLLEKRVEQLEDRQNETK